MFNSSVVLKSCVVCTIQPARTRSQGSLCAMVLIVRQYRLDMQEPMELFLLSNKQAKCLHFYIPRGKKKSQAIKPRSNSSHVEGPAILYSLMAAWRT